MLIQVLDREISGNKNAMCVELRKVVGFVSESVSCSCERCFTLAEFFADVVFDKY